MKSRILLAGLLFFAAAAFSQSDSEERVVLETSLGTIVIELDGKNAPISVESFLENVDAGVYDGSIFHRVIPNFMVQGGGFMTEMKEIVTDKNLQNEADNGLKNLRGTVAMARRPDPHSASIQFYINVADNGFLDHTSKSARGWGYAVFGRVLEGMEVADAISKVARGASDVPKVPVVIESVKRQAPLPVEAVAAGED